MHSSDDPNCPYRAVVLEVTSVLNDSKKKLSELAQQLSYLENKLNSFQNVSDVPGNRFLTRRTGFYGTDAESRSGSCSREETDITLTDETAAEVARNIKVEPLEPGELEGCENSSTAYNEDSSSRKRSVEDCDKHEKPTKHQKCDVREQPGSSRTVDTLRGVSVKTEVPERSPSCEITAPSASESSNENSDQSLSLLSGVFCPRALRALKNIGFVTPELQAQVILPMLNGRNLVVSRGNGSVKTAAFLIAAVEMLCQQKPLSFRGTKVLILCQTSARTSQTYNILTKLMSIHSGLTSGILIKMGKKKFHAEKRILSQGLHIVVSTLNKFICHLYAMNVYFSDLQCIIFDNVELTLTNQDSVKKIVTLLPCWKQVAVFTRNTIPQLRDIDEILGPNLLCVTVDKVSSSPNADGLKHYYVHCKITERNFILYKFLKKFHRSEKVIVFFSSKCFINYYNFWLNELGVRVYTTDIQYKGGEEITNNLDFFTVNTGILLCTDRCGGLDIDGVTVVIHYDCHPVQEYIHNVSYAAQGVNSKGKSFILLDPSQDMYLHTLKENGIYVQKYNLADDEVNIEEFHLQLQKVVRRNSIALAAGKRVCMKASEFNPMMFNSLAVKKSFGL